jgi:hypothetical protein
VQRSKHVAKHGWDREEGWGSFARQGAQGPPVSSALENVSVDSKEKGAAIEKDTTVEKTDDNKP